MTRLRWLATSECAAGVASHLFSRRNGCCLTGPHYIPVLIRAQSPNIRAQYSNSPRRGISVSCLLPSGAGNNSERHPVFQSLNFRSKHVPEFNQENGSKKISIYPTFFAYQRRRGAVLSSLFVAWASPEHYLRRASANFLGPHVVNRSRFG